MSIRHGVKLRPEERQAIRSLERLQQRWPPSLWLAAMDGSLYVMRKDANGERVVHAASGRIDQAGIVASIDGIEADGGGW